jgi:hypothetical protein
MHRGLAGTQGEWDVHDDEAPPRTLLRDGAGGADEAAPPPAQDEALQAEGGPALPPLTQETHERMEVLQSLLADALAKARARSKQAKRLCAQRRG